VSLFLFHSKKEVRVFTELSDLGSVLGQEPHAQPSELPVSNRALICSKSSEVHIYSPFTFQSLPQIFLRFSILILNQGISS